MAGTFIIKVAGEIAASHIINGYQGDCARLHGHNYKIEIAVKLDAAHLNDLGIAIDFKDLRRLLQSILDPLDHRHLNDLKPFDSINPTAENISVYIYQAAKQALSERFPEVVLDRVTVFETERALTSYYE